MAYSKENKLSQMNKENGIINQRSSIKSQCSIDELTNRKMFVGGLHHLINEAELKEYFNQYGEIEKVIIMKDKITNKSRGMSLI